MTGCVVSAEPAVPLPGCVWMSSVVTGPCVTVNAVLSAAVSAAEVAVSTYPVPGRSMRRFVNVATPLTGATLSVPRRLAPNVPVPPLFATTMFVG